MVQLKHKLFTKNKEFDPKKMQPYHRAASEAQPQLSYPWLDVLFGQVSTFLKDSMTFVYGL